MLPLTVCVLCFVVLSPILCTHSKELLKRLATILFDFQYSLLLGISCNNANYLLRIDLLALDRPVRPFYGSASTASTGSISPYIIHLTFSLLNGIIITVIKTHTRQKDGPASTRTLRQKRTDNRSASPHVSRRRNSRSMVRAAAVAAWPGLPRLRMHEGG